MSEQCAVVGVGQTHHKKRRDDVSIPGLLREAALRALEDADMTFADIDAVVIGKAPDAFEGIVQPELFLADALGGAGKPMLRVHTAGSVGGSTFIVGSHLVESRIHERVLAISWEKQSEGNAQWGLAGGRSRGIGAGGAFAPWIRAYIEQTGAPEYIGWQVAVKDRLNALKNPYAHLQLADISIEKVKESPMLWDPLRFLESCPSSDGACAHDVYKQANISVPRQEIDVAELYVPFSWYEPMWLEGHDIAGPGEGWKMVESGETELTGSFPVNPSGGVLSSNPIGASGMLRFAEAALQVRGLAGEHQVDGARTALGHAYGGGSQFFAMWVVGSDQP